ncbi:MAG: TetR/AcrR family transcriptional regulator [Woeseiaceae bacterium]
MSAETDHNRDGRVRRQQQRSIVTQQKLLDAAVEAFSENGFKGTSTRDIAERAGVHHPLITYHFKNKDQLWRAATDKVFREFRKALAGSFQDSTDDCPKSRMASLIRAYVYYAKLNPAMHKVLVQEAHFPNERLDWLIETHLKPFFEPVFGLIEELQRLGVAPAGNAKLLFNMIRLSSGGLLALGNELKASSDIDVDSGETLDEIADMIVTVFLPGEVPSTA